MPNTSLALINVCRKEVIPCYPYWLMAKTFPHPPTQKCSLFNEQYKLTDPLHRSKRNIRGSSEALILLHFSLMAFLTLKITFHCNTSGYYIGLNPFFFSNVKQKDFSLSLEDLFLHGKLDIKKITHPYTFNVLFFPISKPSLSFTVDILY